MDDHSAAGNGAKADNIHRSGAGDMDINTTVQASVCGSAIPIAEGGEYERAAATTNALDSAQSAQMALLANKSPKSYIYKAYDKHKRTRSFIPHWVVEYPWLEFNPDKECMFCMYCREYQRTHDQEFTNTFVHGATNFRLDSVKAHDHSTKHRQVMLVMTGKLASIPKVPGKPSPKGPSVAERLRIGAFFSGEHDTQDDMSLTSKMPNARQVSDTLSEEHALQRHGLPSSDLTEDPVYTPNPMANYLQTLHGLYPSAPLGELDASEPRPSTSASLEGTLPTATSTLPASTGVSSGLQHLKDEPLSPEESSHQEDFNQEDFKRKRDEEEAGEEAEEEEKEGDEREDDGRVSSSGSVAMVRQGKRIIRQLPRSKRRKLEKLIAQQMYENEFGIVDDTSAGFDVRELLNLFEELNCAFDLNAVNPIHGDEKTYPWRQLAESFAFKYQQLSEEHAKELKSIQDTVTSLEKKCQELDAKLQDQTNSLPSSSSAEETQPQDQSNNSNTEKESSGIRDPSPRINMYSSVVILQVPGQEPVRLGGNSRADFNSVERDLARCGIHINLNGTGLPNVAGVGGEPPGPSLCSSRVDGSQSPSGAVGRKDAFPTPVVGSQPEVVNGLACDKMASSSGTISPSTGNHSGVKLGRNPQLKDASCVQTNGTSSLSNDKADESDSNSGADNAVVAQPDSLHGSLAVSSDDKLPEDTGGEQHCIQAAVPIKTEDLLESSECEDLVIDAEGGLTDETAVPDVGLVT
ncbi:uncharacterized protein [Diadema antillarum]|uniref:uncharacterized protein n=1 Tax=Diadema antillarum TaxID=105358 RepID=UPI003A8C6FF5